MLSSTLTSHRLYALSGGQLSAEHAYLANQLPTLQSWHRHLGHANYRAIYDLACSGYTTGMPIDLSAVPPKCDHCILGKQTKTSIPKTHAGDKASRKLGIVHVDLMEHPDTVSVAGNKYIMDIIDDHSSYAWAIHLAAKSDAFNALQAWALAREVKTSSKIGIYRSDNGELKTDSMRDWLLSRGSQHQFTAPHTSAQNGRVERLHRTLMGKACTMRSTCGIPVNHWDEFLLTACYLSNWTPVTSQGSHTPFEHWTGKKPDLLHLREIGCRAFVLVQNHHNPKVYSRSVECVLIGYSLDSKSYCCYHRESHKVFVSYHVSFIESHQCGTMPPPVIAPTSATSMPNIALEEVPDNNTTPFHPSTPMTPDLPRHSGRATKPSKHRCAMVSYPIHSRFSSDPQIHTGSITISFFIHILFI